MPTGITKDVWLHLLEVGGQWTAPQLAEELGRNKTSLFHVCASMVDSGHLACERAEERTNGCQVTFSLTSACKVPRSITLYEIAQAMKKGRHSPVAVVHVIAGDV